MKYLVHLSMPPSFTQLAKEYLESIREHVAGTSSLGFHCTLMRIGIDPAREEELVAALETVRLAPFISTLEDKVELFDRNALVARIERNSQIATLHYAVIEQGREFIDWKDVPALDSIYSQDSQRQEVYNRYGTPYYGPFYNPHVSLCDINQGSFADIKEKNYLAGYTWVVNSFSVSKKDEEWKRVKNIGLHS